MSNKIPDTSHQHDGDTWNTSQLFKITGVVGALAVATLMASKMEDNSVKKGTHSQSPIVEAFLENRDTFQGVQIIQIGNPEEIDTLKVSGKDAWYFFREGNTITYWRKESGTIETNTSTLTY